MSDEQGRYDPRRVGIVSSGDAEADQREIEDYIKSKMLMDEGMCPNGCGPRSPGMGADDEHPEEGGSYCPECGFVCNVDLPQAAR